MASTLIEMACNLIEMAFNLIAMASTLVGLLRSVQFNTMTRVLHVKLWNQITSEIHWEGLHVVNRWSLPEIAHGYQNFQWIVNKYDCQTQNIDLNSPNIVRRG